MLESSSFPIIIIIIGYTILRKSFVLRIMQIKSLIMWLFVTLKKARKYSLIMEWTGKKHVKRMSTNGILSSITLDTLPILINVRLSLRF